MKTNTSTESNQKLANAIEECQKIAKDSAREAKENVAFIKESISQANKEVESCIKEISKLKIRDNEMLTPIKEQLAKIKTTFVNDYNNVANLVEKKERESGNFNITLFGRTTVGKSTLMEILTNGDGKSIGGGGQRTTREVIQYKWRGLTIYDVPGIDAFKGEEDENIAFEAAKSADLIIFMISDGQPEKTEAEWLVRLKREDKPIICLCNAHRTLSNDIAMKIYMDHHEEILSGQRVKEIIEQFNKFVREDLPNEHIDIIVTQLQARYFANKPEYASKRNSLIKASGFDKVESEIQKLVIKDGLSFRRKCFLSIIDSPLYNQSLQLFDNSTIAYKRYQIANGKMAEFCNWQRDFVYAERTMLLQKVDQIYEDVIKTIPGFVEDNIESSDFDSRWERKINAERLNSKVQKCYDDSFEKAKTKVDQIFSDLKDESDLQLRYISEISTSLSNEKITNWKRGWGRASAGIGVIGTIATGILGLASPIGWICLGVSFLFGLFSLFSDSQQSKLDYECKKQTKKLQKLLIESKKETKRKIYEAFNSNIKDGLLSEAYNRLHIIEATLLALANSQRELGLSYLKHHCDISKRIVQSALYDLNVNRCVLDHIQFVARIPGKKTIIGCNDDNIGLISHKISDKIGNKEDVRIFRNDLHGTLESKLTALKGYFKLKINTHVVTVEKDGFKQDVVFIPQNCKLNAEDETNLLLLQQILNIHIIKR